MYLCNHTDCISYAFNNYYNKTQKKKIGIGIAGNAGRLWGALGDLNNRVGTILRDEIINKNGQVIRRQFKTQEESVIQNAYVANNRSSFIGLNPSKNKAWSCDSWGVIHNSASKKTHQRVDYTQKSSDAHYKYYKAVSAETSIIDNIYQAQSRTIDNVVLVVVAGPNNGCRGKKLNSTMSRTIDPGAHRYSYFRQAIVVSLAAMFDEMHAQGVDIAIVPGLSCGIYAGTHTKHKHSSEFSNIINDALCYQNVNRTAYFHAIHWVMGKRGFK